MIVHRILCNYQFAVETEKLLALDDRLNDKRGVIEWELLIKKREKKKTLGHWVAAVLKMQSLQPYIRGTFKMGGG